MFDIPTAVDLIQNFGFPIAVAVWALWRLDKNWGKGESIQNTLADIEQSLARIELILNRNTEIQSELTTTIKILQAIIGKQNWGE
jgi:hypothetical protein